MAYKIQTTNHNSESCPGVTFRIFRKTMGRRIDLDNKLATEYNSEIRKYTEQRALLYEEAKAKALQAIGVNTEKSQPTLIQISKNSSDGSQVADQIDPQNSPQFQLEVVRNLDYMKISELDEKVNALRLAKLRPIYMDVYLHSVVGIEDEDETAVDYKHNMSAKDKERFYRTVPSELIEEIFVELDKEIVMNDQEKANFELPTTGAAAGVGTKTDADITVKNAVDENSTETATAASQT